VAAVNDAAWRGVTAGHSDLAHFAIRYMTQFAGRTIVDDARARLEADLALHAIQRPIGGLRPLWLALRR
jgi:hypothetical protein